MFFQSFSFLIGYVTARAVHKISFLSEDPRRILHRRMSFSDRTIYRLIRYRRMSLLIERFKAYRRMSLVIGRFIDLKDIEKNEFSVRTINRLIWYRSISLSDRSI